MQYQNLVKDFAHRTRRNLEVIEQTKAAQPDADVYEVTQLINSMLGLLVFPQQAYYEAIPDTPLAELKESGWPVPDVTGKYPQASTLRELVRYMRNAIAHFNIEFLLDETSQIAGIKLWNMNRGQRTWETRLRLEDLREITKRFVEMLCEDKEA